MESPEENNQRKHVRDGNTDKTVIGGMNSYLDFIMSSEQARKVSEISNDQDATASLQKRISSPTEVEKGQVEVESRIKKGSSHDQSHIDNGPDHESYNFTEDQKRAMAELLVQKQEDADLLDEEPPEYDVKDRLVQLNKELANDPTPIEADREHKVGFKPKIVDLMASPPPDYSDDEPQSSSNRQEPKGDITSATIQKKNGSLADNTDVLDTEEPIKRQFVVERDGQFSVVSATDLTPTEQYMFTNENDSKQNTGQKIGYQMTNYKSDPNKGYSDGDLATSTYANITPTPPSRPRSKSVAPDSRRSFHPAQSSRTRSTGQLSNSVTYFDKFTYVSPYAMTSEQKAEAQEQARKSEKERVEKEKLKKLMDEERRRENENAFQTWLYLKQEQENQRQENDKKIEKSEQERKEEIDRAYKDWMKEKRSQVKQERLLRRQQQEEWSEGFFLHSREECEKAFKEWLKKKNAELKRQQMMERQRNRLMRIQVKQNKKALAFIRALKESQAFRYMDYYGYRF